MAASEVPNKASASAATPSPANAPRAVGVVKPVPVGAPVRKTYRRGRHVLLMLSFVICVVLPGAGTAYYMWAVAADQYVSKVGFTVRREDTNSAFELLGGLGALSGSSSSDTDILYEFIQSQKLVSDMDRDVNLRRIWTRAEEDPVFRLAQDASIEDLVTYWNSMVQLSYGVGSGLLEVEARAFDPDEATLITETLFAKSSEMINELSDIAREDSIRYARNELDTSLERLKKAREIVTLFRNENQMIDPDIDLHSQAGLMSNLQAQLVETLIDYDLLVGSTQAGDPRIQQAERRLEVIQKRLDAERQKLGFGGQVGDERVLADVVGEYERLAVDREFAEQAYIQALSSYNAAQAEALRQSRYLAAYMEPTRAETAEYPRRGILTGLITLFLFLIWAIAALVVYSVKDRR